MTLHPLRSTKLLVSNLKLNIFMTLFVHSVIPGHFVGSYGKGCQAVSLRTYEFKKGVEILVEDK